MHIYAYIFIRYDIRISLYLLEDSAIFTGQNTESAGRMRAFFSFEQKALRTLISPIFGPATIDVIVREATLDSVQFSHSSYFVQVTHPKLRLEPSQFDSPVVLGSYEDIEVRLSASIENRILRLTGETTNGRKLPTYFRERDVRITMG